MRTRITKVTIWALGAVLALSGIGFATPGGLLPGDQPTVVMEDDTGGAQEDAEQQDAEEQENEEGEQDEGEQDEDAETDDGAPAGSKWSTEDCPEGYAGNHGGYVSSSERSGQARSQAARSRCGKPVGSDTGDGETPEEDGEVATSRHEDGHRGGRENSDRGRSRANDASGERSEERGKSSDNRGQRGDAGQGAGRPGR